MKRTTVRALQGLALSVGSPIGWLAMSFGAAALEGEGAVSAGDLFERADAAVYRAKTNGRNCVATADVALKAPMAAATPVA